MPATTGSSPDDLAVQLAAAQTTTIYVDADLKNAAAALLGADPPLHAEHDAVRDKWAVRKATDDEIEAGKAAHSAEHHAATAHHAASTTK
jgi:hypothetical protein